MTNTPSNDDLALADRQYLESLATSYEVRASANRGHPIIKREYETIAAALRRSAAPPVGGPVAWRHKKRGSTYSVIGIASLQAEPSADLCEGDEITVYRGDDGKLWCRRREEFEDGRFELLAAPQPQEPALLTTGLTQDFAQALPGGKLDDSTYEKIETALDQVDAPCTDASGKWLSLHERITALSSTQPQEPACREALEKCAGAIGPLLKLSSTSENHKIRFTGKWAHLGTISVAQILDEANASLSSPVSRTASPGGDGILTHLERALSQYDKTIDRAKGDEALSDSGRETIIQGCLAAKAAVRSFAENVSANRIEQDGGIRDALEPLVHFVSAPAFKYFPDDFVLTTGSSMAMRQLTAGDFRKLLASLPASGGGK